MLVNHHLYVRMLLNLYNWDCTLGVLHQCCLRGSSVLRHVALAQSFHCGTVFHCVAISQLAPSPDGHWVVSRFLLSPMSLPPVHMLVLL